MRRRGFLALGAAALAAPARPFAVIAHRGDHTRHPDNSLEAVSAAIALGVDYVELDVRTAPGGALVLQHDALRPGQGPGLPRFDDALDLLRHRCGLYLDWKAADPAPLAATLRRHDMLDRTVVYGSPARLAALAALEPRLRIMPEAVDAPTLARLLRELNPKVVAFDRRDFRDDVLALARRAAVDIFVDRLGPDDTEPAWADALARGATGIQTDRPAHLLAFRKTIPTRAISR